MTRIFLILAVLTFLSFRHSSDQSNQSGITNDRNKLNLLKPFKIKISDVNYSMSFALQYILTEKEIVVIFKNGLEDEKDSMLFQTDLQPTETLSRISNIDFGSLKESCSNPCIQDGSRLRIEIIKDGKNKNVRLSDYYQPDIGYLIEQINSLIPKKYIIWYDMAKLLKEQEIVSKFRN